MELKLTEIALNRSKNHIGEIEQIETVFLCCTPSFFSYRPCLVSTFGEKKDKKAKKKNLIHAILRLGKKGGSGGGGGVRLRWEPTRS